MDREKVKRKKKGDKINDTMMIKWFLFIEL